VKLEIGQALIPGVTPGYLHHTSDRVSISDMTLGPYNAGESDRGFTGAAGNIQYSPARNDAGRSDKGAGYGAKH